MNVWLLSSLVVHAAAIAWCATLWARRRQAPMGVALLILALMGVRRLFALHEHVVSERWWPLDLTPLWSEIVALFISVLALVILAMVERRMRAGAIAGAHLRMLGAALDDCGEAAIITTAAAASAPPRIVYVNEAACRLYGYTRDELIGQTPEILECDCSDRATIDRICNDLRSGRIAEGELWNCRKDRSRVLLRWSVSPVRDAAGRVTHQLALLHDVTARREAEAKLSRSEQRLSLVVRQSPMASIVWDLEFRVIEWNPAAEGIFGYPAHEAMGRHARFIVPEEVQPHVDEVWRALMARAGGTRSTNVNVTRAGERIHCEWYNTPLIGPDGRVVGVASLVENVTERVHAEERQRLLMLELDHRVKNNLAVVLSLAEHSLHSATGLRDFSESFLGRLRALARMHTLLAQSRWRGAPLRELLERSIEAFTLGSGTRVLLHGPDIDLSTREASALSMVVHELATNAAKHGALSAPGGTVTLSWRVDPPMNGEGEPALRLEWSEQGGPPVTPPARRGVGLTVIEEALTYELNGHVRLEFDPAGVRCGITIPRPGTRGVDSEETAKPTARLGRSTEVTP